MENRLIHSKLNASDFFHQWGAMAIIILLIGKVADKDE
jgi:hypothetical protein